MYYPLLAQGAQAADAASKAGLSVVESSLLGAIAVLSLLVAIFSVWRLNVVQNLRVEDQRKMSERMEKLTEKLTTTFSEFSNTMTNLNQTEKDGQQLLRELKSSVDSVVLEAVRRGGSVPYSRGPDRGSRER